MSTSTNFEELVLASLGRLETDVSGLKTDVSALKTDVEVLKHKADELDARTFTMNMKLDRVDRKIDDNTHELKQEIRLQGKYLNQAFGYITDLKMRELTK